MATRVLWVVVVVPALVLSVQPPPRQWDFQRRFRRSGNNECGDGDVQVGRDPVSLSSPGFPDFYPANVSCTWRLTASQGDRINITAETFSVESSMGCLFDHVIIYDGAGSDSEVLGRFCGNSVFSVDTTSNRAFIVFVSDISYEGIGFKLEVSTAAGPIKGRILKKADCNSTFTSGPGTIVSPNFPLPADHNTYCTYHIQAPQGKIVQLTFNFFHLESCRLCGCDYLGVYEGNVTEDGSVARFCGHRRPPLVRSRGRDMLVVFKMDDLYRQAGFNATFSFVAPDFDPYYVTEGAKDCSGVFTTAGELKSPGYPGYYPPNTICVSVLQAPKGQTVNLEVREFKLEGNSTDCRNDRLTISDPPEIRYRQSFRLCGGGPAPANITSIGNTLIVRFESDYSVTDTGYVLDYTFVEGSGCRLPCKNHGECILQDGKPTCECLIPYSGELCEIRPSGCSQDPCQNGGSCDPVGQSYRCTCPHGFGGEHCNIDMRKELMFELVTENRTDLSAGSFVTLQCSVNWKQAKISWKYNGRDLFQSMIERLGIEVHQGGVLMIPELSPGKAGRYSCLATDDRGEAIQHDVWVTIAQTCDLKINVPPADAAERNGRQSHVFQCSSDHLGVTYTWLKDGVPIYYDTRVTLLVNNYLQIQNVSFEDAGQYMCEVKDSSGCVVRASAELTVLGRGDISKACGKPTNSFPGDISSPMRIVGGKKARKGAYPWHVRFYNTDKREVFCGGSIISENWVVTAAHCIMDTSYFSLGTTRLYAGSNDCQPGGVELIMDGKPTVHENFDQNTFDNDIALIRVREAIKFTPDVQPLCIQSRSVVERFILRRSVAHVAGCGRLSAHGNTPDELMEIELPIRHEDDCRKSLPAEYTMTDSMLCAGFNTAGPGDSCKGDSGGGLVAKLSGRYTLVGVVSWGIGCARPGQYGFYTIAARFFGWMHRIMQK